MERRSCTVHSDARCLDAQGRPVLLKETAGLNGAEVAALTGRFGGPRCTSRTLATIPYPSDAYKGIWLLILARITISVASLQEWPREEIGARSGGPFRPD